MPENMACQEFESKLQDAMDLRCSPRESCGCDGHLNSCEPCRRLLEEFCLLNQSLELFCLTADVQSPDADTGYVCAEPEYETSPHEPAHPGRFSRTGRRFPDPVAVAVCAVLLCAFFLGTKAWTGDSFPSQVSGYRIDNSLNSNLLAIAPNRVSPLPETRVESEPTRQSTIPIRPAIVAANSNRPVQSFASCIRIADQIPGVPPIRWSVTNTVNWFWSSLPELPRIPTLRQIMPGFGQKAQSLPLQWA